jgi:hypothetical protein
MNTFLLPQTFLLTGTPINLCHINLHCILYYNQSKIAREKQEISVETFEINTGYHLPSKQRVFGSKSKRKSPLLGAMSLS